MKRPTVIEAIRERPIEEKNLVEATNLEVVKVLRSTRNAINSRPRFWADFTTAASGTNETAWESEEMPTDGAWHIRAYVVGMATDGTGKNASYEMSALVQSLSSTLSPIGSLTKTAWESDAALDANIGYDATERIVAVTVNDGALAAMQWRIVVDIVEVVL